MIISINFNTSPVESSRGESSRGAAARGVTVKPTLEEMKYLLKFIFPFLRSGVEVKRGVEFCHSTRNDSRIRQKVGNEVS